MVKPSQRREMAQRAVSEKAISIRLACLVFSVSETCYRYQAKLSHQNAEIADWLVRLIHNHRNWGVPSVTLVVRLINFNRTDNTEFNNGLLQHRLQRTNAQENDAA